MTALHARVDDALHGRCADPELLSDTEHALAVSADTLGRPSLRPCARAIRQPKCRGAAREFCDLIEATTAPPDARRDDTGATLRGGAMLRTQPVSL
jgi:hypothetical protein